MPNIGPKIGFAQNTYHTKTLQQSLPTTLMNIDNWLIKRYQFIDYLYFATQKQLAPLLLITLHTKNSCTIYNFFMIIWMKSLNTQSSCKQGVSISTPCWKFIWIHQSTTYWVPSSCKARRNWVERWYTWPVLALQR